MEIFNVENGCSPFPHIFVLFCFLGFFWFTPESPAPRAVHDTQWILTKYYINELINVPLQDNSC